MHKPSGKHELVQQRSQKMWTSEGNFQRVGSKTNSLVLKMESGSMKFTWIILKWKNPYCQ